LNELVALSIHFHRHCETIPPQRKAWQSSGGGNYRKLPHPDCRVSPNKSGLLAMTQWLNLLNGFVIPAEPVPYLIRERESRNRGATGFRLSPENMLRFPHLQKGD